MSTQRRFHVPRHAIAKAIEYTKRVTESDMYPVREINGMTGDLIRTVYRKRKVPNLRASFIRTGGYTFGITFERTV